MSKVAKFFKYLFLDTSLFAIIMTLTLYTYPTSSLAIDENGGVYKPGEEFNDALAKTNESAEGSGLMGMVEQFVALGFAAAAISSLKFKHTERSLADCSQNKNANITLRLLQAGGLAYLLGEIKAKAEFKKASKLATDAAFAVKQKEDESTEEGQAANQKQVEAYETLIKVYDHKIKGIKTKRTLAILAELAYLGALGMEIVKTKELKNICIQDRQKYTTKKDAHIASLRAFLTTVTTTQNTMRPLQCDGTTGIPCAAYTPYGACGIAKRNVEGLIAIEDLERANQAVGGENAAIAATGRDIEERQTIGKRFFSLKNIMIALAAGALIKSTVYHSKDFKNIKRVASEKQNLKKKKDLSFGELLSAFVQDYILISNAHAGLPALAVRGVSLLRTGGSAASSTALTVQNASRAAPASGFIARRLESLKENYPRLLLAGSIALKGLQTVFFAADAADLAETVGGLATTPAAEEEAARQVEAGTDAELANDGANAEAQETQEQRYEREIAAIESDESVCYVAGPGTFCPACSGYPAIEQSKSDLESEQNPIRCCGSDVTEGVPTGLNDNIPNPGVVDKKIDVTFEKLPLIGDSNIINFIKPGLLNIIEHKYFHDYQIAGKSNEEILKDHRAFYQYLNHLEENFDKEINNSHEVKAFDAKMAKLDFNNDENYYSALSTITNNLFISDAKALDFSGLLGFGIKLFLVYKITAKFFRTKALNKPKNRMYTFGTIAAINALIILFQGKRLKDNEKQRDVIKAELEKFKKSHALKTGLGLEEAKKGIGDLVKIADNTLGGRGAVSGTPTIACAVGSSGASRFAPAPCPARPLGDIAGIRRGDLSNREAKVSPLLTQVPALVNDATNAAASGLDQTDPKAFEATLDGATRNLNAVKSEVDRLAKDLDNTDPLLLKDEKGNAIQANPLTRALATIRKANSAGTTQQVNDTALTAESKKSLEEALEEAEKKGQADGKPLATIPSQGPVTPVGSDPFDFGGSSGAGGISDYSELKGKELDYEGQRADLNYAKDDIINNEGVNIFKVLNNRYLKSYDLLLTELPERDEEDSEQAEN